MYCFWAPKAQRKGSISAPQKETHGHPLCMKLPHFYRFLSEDELRASSLAQSWEKFGFFDSSVWNRFAFPTFWSRYSGLLHGKDEKSFIFKDGQSTWLKRQQDNPVSQAGIREPYLFSLSEVSMSDRQAFWSNLVSGSIPWPTSGTPPEKNLSSRSQRSSDMVCWIPCHLLLDLGELIVSSDVAEYKF